MNGWITIVFLLRNWISSVVYFSWLNLSHKRIRSQECTDVVLSIVTSLFEYLQLIIWKCVLVSIHMSRNNIIFALLVRSALPGIPLWDDQATHLARSFLLVFTSSSSSLHSASEHSRRCLSFPLFCCCWRRFFLATAKNSCLSSSSHAFLRGDEKKGR